MKKEITLLVLPVAALVAFGYFRSKSDAQLAKTRAAPFKFTITNVTVEPETNPQSGHNVNVRVVIDHDGPTPKWWCSPQFASIPNLQIGDTHMVDDTGKQYRQIKFHSYSTGIYGMSQSYDRSQQSYIYIYQVNTHFVPDSVKHLTFKSKLIHPTGTNQISAVVRDTK